MPLTPNAPDYIGAVRAAINDLRENYLKKEQLRITEENNQAQIGVQYAQIAASRANADRQADLEGQRLMVSAAAHNSQAAQQSRQLENQQAEQSLRQDRFEFDKQKEANDLALQKEKDDKDKTANVLESEYFAAMSENDPAKIQAVLQKIGTSNITSAQRLQLHQNVNIALAANRDLKQREKNEQTMQQARELSTKINTLRAEDFTPDQFEATVTDLANQFYGLGNTDDNVLKIFQKAQSDTVARAAKWRESTIGREVTEFTRLAEERSSELGPEFLKKYAELEREFGSGEKIPVARLRGLMKERNRQEAERTLASWRADANQRANNLMLTNPRAYAVRAIDPKTGNTYITFAQPPPTLLPEVGYNGTIDPDTGKITKTADAAYRDWVNRMTSPGIPFGNVSLTKDFQSNQTVAPAPEDEAAKRLPFVANPAWVMATPPSAGATAMIPTAPGQALPPVTAGGLPQSAPSPIKPETLQAIRDLRGRGYKGDYPPGSGIPFDSVVAKLKAQGYDLDSVPGQLPTAGSGQLR